MKTEKQIHILNIKQNTLFGICAWLITLFILLRTIGQILFKHIALRPGGSNYISLFLDPLFYLSGVIFFLQAVVWLLVLKRMALSAAYPFSSITVITMLISGALFFGESISLGNIIGSIFIMTGVIVIASDKTKSDGGNLS